MIHAHDTIETPVSVRRRLLLAVSLAALVGLSAPMTDPAARAPSPEVARVPAKLVGMWGRRVTEADVKRANAPFIATGRWRLQIAATGALRVFNTPGAVPIMSAHLRIRAGTVTFVRFGLASDREAGCPSPGVYRWRASGGVLTLAKAKDNCPDRVAILAGKWRRA